MFIFTSNDKVSFYYNSQYFWIISIFILFLNCEKERDLTFSSKEFHILTPWNLILKIP
jgi:hypothetical protein